MDLTVAIDVSSAVDPRPSGVARYIVGLVTALGALPDSPELRLRVRPARLTRGRLPDPLRQARWLLPWQNATAGTAAFHGPDLRLPRRRGRGALIATIHDLSHLTAKEHATADFVARKVAQIRRAAAQAHGVITHSETVRDGLVLTLGLDPARVTAVPLADSLPHSVADEPRGETLLLVGGPSARKGSDRLPRLLRHWADRMNWRPSIIWAGTSSAGHAEEFLGRLTREERGRVRFAGHVSDGELDRLYHRSAGLLSLSALEGFGLPLLEAANRNCPVLALETPVLRELLGDSAFWFGDDLEASATFARFREPSERARIGAEARVRVRDYSWERTARSTLAVYRRAVAESQRRG